MHAGYITESDQTPPSLQLTVVEAPTFLKILPSLQVILTSHPATREEVAVRLVPTIFPSIGFRKDSSEQEGAVGQK